MTPFTSRQGVALFLKPVSPYLNEKIKVAHEREHPEPVRPTYEVKTGDPENPDIITKPIPDDPDEEKGFSTEQISVYQEWKALHDKWQKELDQLQTEAHLYYGVTLDYPAHDWEAEDTALGLEVPSGIKEKKLHYIYVHVIAGDDLVKMIQVIRLLTMGLTPSQTEDADALNAFFLRVVQGALSKGLA